MSEIFYLIIALAVCISVHEASHAFVAHLLGDDTAKSAGRMSLNPLKHLDLLGTIMIFLVHFGWGKPVPFNYYNLKHPRRDAALISMAGPVSNLLTAMLIAVLIKYIAMPQLFHSILSSVFQLSIVLFLFNLIPIAPLDGSKLIGLVIPASKENWYQKFLSQGPMYLIILIVADRLLSEAANFSPLGYFLSTGYDFITVLIMMAT